MGDSSKRNRIYLVTMDNKQMLVKANSRTAAANHFTKGVLEVSIATQEDLLEAGRAGLSIEQAEVSTRGRKPRN